MTPAVFVDSAGRLPPRRTGILCKNAWPPPAGSNAFVSSVTLLRGRPKRSTRAISRASTRRASDAPLFMRPETSRYRPAWSSFILDAVTSTTTSGTLLPARRRATSPSAERVLIARLRTVSASAIAGDVRALSDCALSIALNAWTASQASSAASAIANMSRHCRR